ncbi:hypothetical protein BN1423_1530016 [Carnobacterium maltaromaticum]|nr:hypothetical protein BN1423_1530016 [Carnobacterium maltaromaticum]
MKMKRIQQIEEYIQEHKHVSLNELCTYFNVSKNQFGVIFSILKLKDF